ncbi:MAG: hypothetical protein ABH827_04290 [bacterium]
MKKASVLETIQGQYIVNERGEKTSIILNIKTFEKLLEELEDAHLGKVATDILKKEKKAKTKRYTLDEIKQQILK